MTTLRHRTRHARHTLASELRDYLDGLGWIDEDGGTVLFGAPTVRVSEIELDPGEKPEPNLVIVAFGPETPVLEEELGGMVSITYDCWVDVFASSDSVMLALTDDVRDWLDERRLTVTDYVTGDATDNILSIEDPQAHPAPSVRGASTQHWRVIVSDAVLRWVPSA